MPPDGSVTRWIGPLQAGDPAAAQELWKRYFRLLVGLAHKKLRQGPRRAADEEDVALSAFNSFYHNAKGGRFPELLDRDSLWRLLVVITARKAARLRRDEGRKKRGGGTASADKPPDLDQLLGREPSPEFAAEVAEECRRLLHALGDPELVAVALARMEGYSVDEVADRIGLAPRSIKRKLRLIRAVWEKELAP
jgi:DNA-directed RNA polymerase specialized sigma24 family protein